MTGNAYLLAFSSRHAIPDFLSMIVPSLKAILAKLAVHTRWMGNYDSGLKATSSPSSLIPLPLSPL